MHPNIDKESTSAIKSNLTSDELGIELTTEVKKVEIVESSEVCTSKKMEMVCEKEGQQQDAVRANEEQLIPESLDEKIIPNNDKLIDPLEESPTAQCIVNELVSSKSLESEPLKRESKEELVKENHELKVMGKSVLCIYKLLNTGNFVFKYILKNIFLSYNILNDLLKQLKN